MSADTALQTIAVGVIVERSKGMNEWTEYLWRPVDVLIGAPVTPAWTKLGGDDERTRFYCGSTQIEFHRTETANYRSNLATGKPQLWVALRPVDSNPPYELFAVTADPAEGEALTESGNNIVEPVAMPEVVEAALTGFIAEHHVERTVYKRKRERGNPEALGRRPPENRK